MIGTRWGCFNDPTQERSTMLNISTLFYFFSSIQILNKGMKKSFNFEFGRWLLVRLHIKNADSLILEDNVKIFLQKISLLAYFNLEKAMKNTLQL